MLSVIASGTVTLSDAASDSVAVTVIGEPSSTGFGDRLRDTSRWSVCGAGASSSVIVISTLVVVPAVTPAGRVPKATLNCSWSPSSSCRVWICVLPLVERAAISMPLEVSESTISGDASVRTSGMVTLLERAAPSVAVTVTADPSSTGLGLTDKSAATSGSGSGSGFGAGGTIVHVQIVRTLGRSFRRHSNPLKPLMLPTRSAKESKPLRVDTPDLGMVSPNCHFPEAVLLIQRYSVWTSPLGDGDRPKAICGFTVRSVTRVPHRGAECAQNNQVLAFA